MGKIIEVPDWDQKLKERRFKYLMGLQLPDPTELTHEVKLLKADPTGDTFVVVKQAATGEDAVISALWAKTAWEFNDADRGKVKQYNDISRAQIVGEQVRLTLLECNIKGYDKKLLFPKVDFHAERDRTSFYAAWAKLPAQWAVEIHEAVLSANPQWRPGEEAQEALGEA